MASKVAVPFFVPTRMNETSCCFYILVSIWSCQFWTVASHSNRCGVVSLCLPSEFSSVQLLSHALQYARLPCPLPAPGACSNARPSSQWWQPTVSFSGVCFSLCLQSFPASGSFPLSQFFASSGQSIGVSASASVLPMNIQGWFPLGLTGLISFYFIIIIFKF